jgi:TatD DNase family protein
VELVDSHVHLDWFAPDALDGVLERAASAGVTRMLTVGSDLGGSRRAVEIAGRYPAVLAAVGIHPGFQEGEVGGREVEVLRELAKNRRVVAIGEVGLDGTASRVPLEMQLRGFRAQLRLARELSLSVVLHIRGALQEALETLDEEDLPAGRAVAHYFTGDAALAEEWVRRGVFVSLAKPLLRSAELQRVAAPLPEEWLLVETDAYPRQPDRWTEPADVRVVVEKLAAVRGVTLSELAPVLAANFRRFLGS